MLTFVDSLRPFPWTKQSGAAILAQWCCQISANLNNCNCDLQIVLHGYSNFRMAFALTDILSFFNLRHILFQPKGHCLAVAQVQTSESPVPQKETPDTEKPETQSFSWSDALSMPKGGILNPAESKMLFWASSLSAVTWLNKATFFTSICWKNTGKWWNILKHVL